MHFKSLLFKETMLKKSLNETIICTTVTSTPADFSQEISIDTTSSLKYYLIMLPIEPKVHQFNTHLPVTKGFKLCLFWYESHGETHTTPLFFSC